MAHRGALSESATLSPPFAMPYTFLIPLAIGVIFSVRAANAVRCSVVHGRTRSGRRVEYPRASQPIPWAVLTTVYAFVGVLLLLASIPLMRLEPVAHLGAGGALALVLIGTWWSLQSKPDEPDVRALDAAGYRQAAPPSAGASRRPRERGVLYGATLAFGGCVVGGVMLVLGDGVSTRVVAGLAVLVGVIASIRAVLRSRPR